MIRKTYYIHHLNDYSGSPSILYNRIRNTTNKSTILVTNHDTGFLSKFQGAIVCFPYVKHENLALRMISLSFWYVFVFVYLLISLRKGDKLYVNTLVSSPLLLAGIIRNNIDMSIAVNEVKYSIPFWSFFGLSLARKRQVKKEYLSNYVKDFWNFEGPAAVSYPLLRTEFYKMAEKIPKHDLNLDPTSLNIYTVSSQAAGKGFDLFIQIAEKAISLDLGHKFTMYLSGSSESFYKRFDKDMLPSNLHIWFNITDITIFWRHEIFLGLTDPTIWVETFGLAFAEAMIASNLVFVPFVGAQLEYVKDGINGFVIKDRDPLAILNNIDRILSDFNIKDIRAKACSTIVELAAGRQDIKHIPILLAE